MGKGLRVEEWKEVEGREQAKEEGPYLSKEPLTVLPPTPDVLKLRLGKVGTDELFLHLLLDPRRSDLPLLLPSHLLHRRQMISEIVDPSFRRRGGEHGAGRREGGRETGVVSREARSARHIPDVLAEVSLDGDGKARRFGGETSHANVIVEPEAREDIWWVWWEFLVVESSGTLLEEVERDHGCSLENELAKELALPHVEGEEHGEDVSGGVGKRFVPAVDSIFCRRANKRSVKSCICSLAYSANRRLCE